jgi:hypothetical protein
VGIVMIPGVFAAEPYVSGSIVTSDEYPPWDRYIDVNGLRILGAPDLGGGGGVSDEFMEKVARTAQLLLDPNAPGIDPAAQMAAMNGMANNCSREGGYPQGLDSNQYGLTLQRTFGTDAELTAFNSVTDDVWGSADDDSLVAEDPRWLDMVFQYNSGMDPEDPVQHSVNGQITEVLEHLLHTFNHFAFPVAYPVDLNIQTPEGPMWEAMQEAIANDVYGISDYADMDDGSDGYYAILMQEYSYLLIYAEWNYFTKYVPGGSLAPEWADNSRTPAGVAANNPLGHTLYQNYLSKIVAKPSSGILDAMYAVDGASGYIATSTGRGTVEPVDCTVDSIAYSIAELQAAAEAQAAAEQAVANAVDWGSLEDSIAELQAAVEAQAAAEQAAADAAAEAVANAAAEVAADAAAEAAADAAAEAVANAAAEAVANAAAEASQASGGCGPGTVLEGNTCVLAPEESSDGCGQGTVMVNGVCQLDKSSGTSIPPLYIAGGAAAIGAAVIGIIFAVRRGSSGSKTSKPAKQDLEEYEEKYIAKQKPAKQKPAEKKETSSSCSNCGKPLKPTAKFCGGCGTPRS